MRKRQTKQLALDALSSGRYEEAAAGLTSVIEHSPADLDAYLNRARARLGLGLADDALADLDEALALDPRCGVAYHERGATLAILHRHEEALRDLDRAIRFAPTSAAYSDRGSVLKRLSRLEEARLDLEQAVQLDPGLAPAHFNLGVLETDRGDLRAAVPHFRSAARLGFPQATPALTQVRQMLFVDGEEDGSMSLAIEAFLDATGVEDLEDALERFPFMALPEFLEPMVGGPNVARLLGGAGGQELRNAMCQRADVVRALADDQGGAI
jgi:tetratricopeptide (TPR) repeat protein